MPRTRAGHLGASRRNRSDHRCGRCRMHTALCLCALLPRVQTRTRVVVVVHHVEARKPSNTGRLATLCLAGSELWVRGEPGAPQVAFEPEVGRRALLLFPHPDAPPLAPAAGSSEPVTLVVPDGSWRQAAKVRARVHGCAALPCVSLPVPERSRYRLRAEPHAHCLSTFEAIVAALAILEGDEAVAALQPVLATMVERSLWARGTVPRGEVTGGVPAGTVRHEPARCGADPPTGRDQRPG